MTLNLQKKRDVANIIMHEWLQLDAKKALLERALINRRTVRKHNREGRSFGFEHLRIALLEAVVVKTSAILYGGKKEASLNNLIPHLEDRNGDAYKKLKSDFAEPQPFTWLDTEEQLDEELKNAMIKDMQEKERKRKENQFDRLAERVCRKYRRMMDKQNIGVKIRGIRDKVIAHLEVKTESGKRRLMSMHDFQLKINELIKCIKNIEDVAAKCVLLYCNTSWIVDDTKKNHKKEARFYWGA